MNMISNSSNIYRVWRYVIIYGPFRTLAKVFGRLRPSLPLYILLRTRIPRLRGRGIGIIGAGQHAYSTIAYSLASFTRSNIIFVIDPNYRAAVSLAKAYNIKNSYSELTENVINDKDLSLVYIASNHSTHADYFLTLAARKIDIFIEKPLCTRRCELEEMDRVVKTFGTKVYAGFNRPFSRAVQSIVRNFTDHEPFSLSCTVFGHKLDDSHWYRNPGEGSRVIGNLAHWIDLSVYLLFLRAEGNYELKISLSFADVNSVSDNMSVTISTSFGDLVCLFFSTRGEPFEGVNEYIAFQQGDFTAKVNNFREIEMTRGRKIIKNKFFPKDVGHIRSVLQPFYVKPTREWGELYASTSLMLHIEDMVVNLRENMTLQLQR